jgi:hypothetical protein
MKNKGRKKKKNGQARAVISAKITARSPLLFFFSPPHSFLVDF